MSEKLIVMEPQLDFPEVDLSDKNAAFLELFLQNQQQVELIHPEVEKSRLLFELAHAAAKDSQDIFAQDEHHASFTHGFTLYEIVSSMVAPVVQDVGGASINVATGHFRAAIQSKDQVKFLVDARDDFLDKQPKTAEVIDKASKRIFPHLTYYAVIGAAIERQLELEAREYDQSLVQ